MVLIRASAVSSITLALLAIAGPLSSLAQGGETWDGNGGDNNWTTNNNWNPNGEPPNDGTANIVMAGTNRLTPRVNVDWDVRSLVFSNTAGGFSISGDPGVSLGVGEGGIVNQDTQTQLLLLPIDLNASQTWIASQGQLSIGNTVAGHPIVPRTLTLSGSNNFQISGAITNSTSLTKNGSGTLTFNGVNGNTYSGNTTVNAGTLVLDRTGLPNRAIPDNLIIGDGSGSDVVRLDSSDQISEAAGNTVTVNGSGLLNLNGFNETIQNLTLNGGSVNGNGTLTVNGVITAGASSASATISDSLVNFGGGTRTINVADGAAAVDLHISSLITNGALTKTGAGVLRLSSGGGGGFPSPQGYQGATIVNEGTLELSHPYDITQLPTILGDVTIGDGVGLDTLRVTTGHLPFYESVHVTVKSSGLLDLNASFSPVVARLDLEGGSVTTGGTTLFTYGLHVLPAAQPATFSGRLDIGGHILDRGLTVDDGTPADDLLFDGFLNDIDKKGPGQMRVIGNTGSFYGESFELREGTVVLDRTAVGIGVGNISVLGGSLVLGGDEQIGAYTSGQIPGSGASDNLLTISGAGASLDLAGFSETISDLSLGSGGAVVPNGGTLALGDLTLAGGVLNPSTGLVTVNGTITVAVSNPSTSLIGGNVVLTAANRSFDVANIAAALDLEVTLALAGTNSLTKTGAGTLLLSGAANTYTGMTTVSGGVLSLGKSSVDGAAPGDLTVTNATVRSAADEQITSSGFVMLNADGVLDLNGFTETIGSLSLNGGTVTMGAGTLVVTGNVSQGTAAASSISGRLDLGGGTRTITSNDVPIPAVDLEIPAQIVNGAIVKQGAGALRLSGNNTFAGSVQHQAGKLLVAHDNALGSGALLLQGGTVEADGGARNISNPVVVANLSTISGTNDLTFGGSFTTNLGSALTKSGTGALTIAGPQTHAAGAALFATAGTMNFNSSATGATLNVNVSNAGTLVNFNADQDLNTLVVNGGRARVDDAALLDASSLSIGPNAVLELEIGGLIAGNEFAQLLISGNAALAGALQITLTNGFSPTAGNSFNILDWGSLSGSFGTLNLPALAGGLAWSTSQLYTTGVLTVAPAFTADFDADGDVDAADLSQWQGDFGANAFSDADADGDSDGDDFLEWQRQLGSPPPATAHAEAVPEPGSALLGLFAWSLLGLARRGAGIRNA